MATFTEAQRIELRVLGQALDAAKAMAGDVLIQEIVTAVERRNAAIAGSDGAYRTKVREVALASGVDLDIGGWSFNLNDGFVRNN